MPRRKGNESAEPLFDCLDTQVEAKTIRINGDETPRTRVASGCGADEAVKLQNDEGLGGKMDKFHLKWWHPEVTRDAKGES